MTIPFYQKPIPWIISLVEKSLDSASMKADGVDSLSMDSTIHTQYADAIDSFGGWHFTQNTYFLQIPLYMRILPMSHPLRRILLHRYNQRYRPCHYSVTMVCFRGYFHSNTQVWNR
jgi:hypothetical protein